MLQRVLWVSLTQALRSVALILLPTAFISLLGWATAGSSNGDTSDPMRVAVWAWLGAHHVPFNLVLPPAGQMGFLSYLPLGALIFPALAARSSFKRGMNRIAQDARSIRLLRLFFSIFYLAIAMLLAWGARIPAVEPVLYWVPIITLPLLWLSTATFRKLDPSISAISLGLAMRMIAVALGVSSLVLGTSLAFQLTTVENLVVVLQPGWLGGLLLFLLNVLYLPNAIVATLAYLVGPGFAVGANTILSPLTHRILEIPALPLLGALPTGRHPMALIGAAAVTLAGVVLYRLSISHNIRTLAQSYFLTVAGIALIAFLSSGSLITKAMGSVGVSTWQVSSAFGLELGLGVFLAWCIPFAIESVRRRRESSL